MDMTKWVTLKLTDNHKPELFGQIKPAVTHDRTPTITWPPGTDLDNDTLGYKIHIWNLNSKDEIIESNTTQKPEYIVNTNLAFCNCYLSIQCKYSVNTLYLLCKYNVNIL